MDTEFPDPPQRRDWRLLRKRALVASLLVVALVSLTAASIVAARSLTPDGLSRDRATQCATPKTYATHTPVEIEDCITRVVRADMASDGVLPTLIDLQRQANRNPMLKGLCHLSLHVLGRDYQRSGVDVMEFDSPLTRDANWNSICVGGFLHGFLQGMSETSSSSDLAQLARTWCTRLADQNREGCAHAVGHGLSRFFDNDLRQSADVCHGLPDTVRNDCLSGAIMELNFADPKIANRLRRKDPDLGPTRDIDCHVVKADQRNWCRAFQLKGVGLVTELQTVG